jgi:putative ABC transport system permease protein
MVLGATIQDGLSLVVRQPLALTLVVVAIGSAVSLLFAKLSGPSAGLNGVTAYDPRTSAVGAALITGVAAVASLVPALRVTHPERLASLRSR